MNISEYRKLTKKKKQPEFESQAEIFKWSKENEKICPDLKWLHGSVVGLKLGWFLGKKAKQIGLKKGIPLDITLPVCRSGYAGLVIEMKSESGRVSTEQKEAIEMYRREKRCVFVCFSAQEAITAIKDYLGI